MRPSNRSRASLATRLPAPISASGVATVAAACVFLAVFAVPPTAAAGETPPPQRFSFGQSMRVEAGERVDTIVTVGADLIVHGEVEDNAVVIGGNLELGPEAHVGGDAVAIGGSIVAPASARVLGDRIEFNGAFGREVTREGRRFGPFAGPIAAPIAAGIATFVQVLASFLISALLLLFVPRRVRGVADQMRAHPGRAVVFGLAILLLFVPLLGVLTISIVGIPLIPVAIMLLAAIMVFGMTALGLRFGYAMPFYSEQRSAMGALAIGYVLIGLIALIPWAGPALVPLLALFAGGSVLASWFGARRAMPSPPERRP
jgi:hypothetical protein